MLLIGLALFYTGLILFAFLMRHWHQKVTAQFIAENGDLPRQKKAEIQNWHHNLSCASKISQAQVDSVIDKQLSYWQAYNKYWGFRIFSAIACSLLTVFGALFIVLYFID